MISIYPTCALRNVFPEGKFTIISDLTILQNIYYREESKQHFLDNQKMVGICHLKILAPENLREPFLGTLVKDKTEEKFHYCFCTKCLKEKIESPCNHKDDQRAHILTLCWPEINYAVEIGYTILQIYECYQYEKESHIFQKFFSLLSREKIRYSKPTTEIKKYIAELNEGMAYTGSLKLAQSDIQPNEVKKKYYKEFLNAILGKLGEQSQRTKTVLIRSQNELDLLDLASVENIFSLKKSCIVFQKSGMRSTRINVKSNSIIYSYVQCYARIVMFKAMCQLWQRNAQIFNISNDALYFSLNHPLTKNDIDCGPLFGQFKNEYLDMKIISYFSFGSKSSCIIFEDKDGKISQNIKARGFSLSSCLSQEILGQYDVKKAMQKALKSEADFVFVPQNRLKRSIVNLTVQDQFLMYRYTNNIQTTRILLSDGMSKSYGYK